MKAHSGESPFYLRFGITVITIAILAAVLHLGRGILVPIFFSILLSTLLLPVVRYLQQRRLGKVLSITITLCIAMLLLSFIVYFLSTQIGNFLDDIPTLDKRFRSLLWEAQKWVRDHLNIGVKAQTEYIEETTDQMNTPAVLNRTFLSITGVISYIVFLPIYTFLILYHKDMIRKFLIAMFKDGNRDKVQEVLTQSQQMSQQFITGLLIEFCIVFVLNSTGFLLLGIKYPIFLGLVAALLNIVPYIG
ncbi:MAG TPA: AI-2E family transporter, partial [Chryseosolibacter sp.]|nr:AI-2E family transporter [Chryseosolibacter sp.]